MSNKSEMAVEQFRKGFNCAQSVFSSFINELDISDDIAFRITSGFGGGMGKLQNTCGAVTGAFMVLSCKLGEVDAPDPELKATINHTIQDFAQKFEKKFGSLNCRQLIDIDLNDPEQTKKAKEERVFELKCEEFIRYSVKTLENYF